MRHSELNRAFADVFGERRGSSLCQDLVLPGFAGRTAAEASADGEDPQAIWRAVCTEMDLPDELLFPHRTRRAT